MPDSPTPPGVAPAPTIAPGQLRYNALIVAGTSQADADQWRAERTRALLLGGATPTEIDDYWGHGSSDPTELRKAFNANLMANRPILKTGDLLTSFQAGLNMSATGLMMSGQGARQNVEPQGLGAKISMGAGQLVGDLPHMLAGMFGGAAGGGAAGAAVPVAGETGASEAIGALIGGGAGAAALPEATRQALIAAYNRGEIHNSDQAWAVVRHAAAETAKAATVGAAGNLVGGPVGAKVARATGSELGGTTANVLASGVTMTGVEAGLNLRVPNRDDFIASSILALGMGVAGHVVPGRGFTPSEAGQRVQNNLQEIYVHTGIPPSEVVERAKTDPVLKQALLAQTVQGSVVLPPTYRLDNPERPMRNVTPGHGEPPPIQPQRESLPEREPIPVTGDISNFMHTMAGVEGSNLPGADRAVSPKGAQGRFQIMPATAEQYGFDPHRLMETGYNEQVARAIAADLYKRYGGDEELMLAAYNAGPGRANALRNEGQGTRLVAIPDRNARGGIRYESETAARNEANLPLETQKYLANARRRFGGELPGSRGGEGSSRLPQHYSIEELPDGHSQGPTGVKLPDWAVYKRPPEDGGGGEPPKPPEDQLALGGGEPPKGNPWDKADEADLFAKLREGIGEQVVTPKSLQDRISDAITHWGSELEPARRIDTEFLKDHPEFNRDKDLLAEDMARLLYSSAERASIFLQHGRVDPITFDVTREGATLMQAGKEVRKAGGNLDDWFTWMAAQRADTLHGRGLETPFDDQAVAAAASRKDVAKKYAEGTKTLNTMMDNIMLYERDSGIYSDEQLFAIKKLNPVYVSFRREFGGDTSGLTGRKSKLKGVKASKRIGGSEEQILDPKLTLIDNVHLRVAIADRNRVVGHFVGLAERKDPIYGPHFVRLEWNPQAMFQEHEGGPWEKYTKDGVEVKPEVPDAFMAERARKGLGNDQFVYYRNGKAELWQAKDPELAKLIRGAENRGEAHIIDKVVTGVASVARAGVVFAPDFAARVSGVDQFSALVFDPRHPMPFVAPILGAMHAFRGFKSDAFLDWAAKGGAGSALVNMDKNYVKADLARIFEETGVNDRYWNVVKHPLHLAQLIHERIDAASRIGYKIMAEKQGVDPIKAALGARKAYLDFSESGTLAFVRAWARWTPFLRPGILGMKQVAEGLYEPSHANPVGRPVTTATYVALGVVVPTVVLYLMNQEADKHLPDGKKYADLPQMERDMYWVTPPILGTRLRLRKPYTLGVVTAGTMERYLEYMRTSDPKAFDHLARSVAADMTLPIIPPAIVAPLEQATNHSFFRDRQLIPDSLKDASGPMQYTPATTEAGKALARLLGPGHLNIAEMSPIIFDNYIREWGGTIGYGVLQALDAPLSPANTGKPGELADNPFVKGFIARNPNMSADSISDFYDQYKEFKQAATDKNLALRRMDPDEMNTYGSSARAYVNLDRIAQILNLQMDAVQAAYNDPKLTTDEKRQTTDSLVEQAIGIAQAGSQLMQSVDADERQRGRVPASGAVQAPAAVNPSSELSAQDQADLGVGQPRQPSGAIGAIKPPPQQASGNPSLGEPLKVGNQ